MRLGRAILFVKDLDAMTVFYRDGLGLRAVPESAEDGWVELDAGGTRLALHAIPAEIAATIHSSNPPHRREATPLKLVFLVDDLEAARARLAASGAVMYDIQSYGACDGLDPEGNVFQIAT